tara:strand:+ start:662 stop:805 length:144 start_codon:yes stop_codon:yes gene_type:complete
MAQLLMIIGAADFDGSQRLQMRRYKLSVKKLKSCVLQSMDKISQRDF